jgi:hypothetical protein
LIKVKSTISGEYPIKNGTVIIANDAFYGCTQLTKVIIPDTVINIGMNAFYNCKAMTSVEIGNSVETISKWSFYKCIGLTNITIPNNVIQIESEAFLGCTVLSSIEFEEDSNIRYIESSAFNGTAYYNEATNWESGILYAGPCLVKCNTTT